MDVVIARDLHELEPLEEEGLCVRCGPEEVALVPSAVLGLSQRLRSVPGG